MSIEASMPTLGGYEHEDHFAGIWAGTSLYEEDPNAHGGASRNAVLLQPSSGGSSSAQLAHYPSLPQQQPHQHQHQQQQQQQPLSGHLRPLAPRLYFTPQIRTFTYPKPRQVRGGPKRKRRTAGEIERTYRCEYPGCPKSYGSDGALRMHVRIKHEDWKANKSHATRISPVLLAAAGAAAATGGGGGGAGGGGVGGVGVLAPMMQIFQQNQALYAAQSDATTHNGQATPLTMTPLVLPTTSATPMPEHLIGLGTFGGANEMYYAASANGTSAPSNVAGIPVMTPLRHAVAASLGPIPTIVRTDQPQPSSPQSSSSSSSSSSLSSTSSSNSSSPASSAVTVSLSSSPSLRHHHHHHHLHHNNEHEHEHEHEHEQQLHDGQASDSRSPDSLPNARDMPGIKLVALQFGRWVKFSTNYDLELVIDFEAQAFHYKHRGADESFDILVDFRSLSSIFVEKTRDNTDTLLSYQVLAPPHFLRNGQPCADFTNSGSMFWNFHTAQLYPTASIGMLCASLRHSPILAKLLEMQLSVVPEAITTPGSLTHHVSRSLSTGIPGTPLLVPLAVSTIEPGHRDHPTAITTAATTGDYLAATRPAALPASAPAGSQITVQQLYAHASQAPYASLQNGSSVQRRRLVPLLHPTPGEPKLSRGFDEQVLDSNAVAGRVRVPFDSTTSPVPSTSPSAAGSDRIASPLMVPISVAQEQQHLTHDHHDHHQHHLHHDHHLSAAAPGALSTTPSSLDSSASSVSTPSSSSESATTPPPPVSSAPYAPNWALAPDSVYAFEPDTAADAYQSQQQLHPCSLGHNIQVHEYDLATTWPLPCGHASLTLGALLRRGAVCPMCGEEYYFSHCRNAVESSSATRHCPLCGNCYANHAPCLCTPLS